MKLSVDEKGNIRKLLEQHWLQCRHIETERALFMSMYAAIVGGILAFVSKGTVISPNSYIFITLVLFLIGLTFFGYFLTLRWVHSFECHRNKVNEFVKILCSINDISIPLDPTMNIPPIKVTPRYIINWKIPRWINKIDVIFRTRYWFPLFYFAVLVGSTILLFIIMKDNFIWIKWVSLIVTLIALLLGIGWNSSLEKIKVKKKVALVGCNGEWARKNYLQFLVNKAKEGLIQLWAIDTTPQIIHTKTDIAAAWQNAVDNGNACYIYKNDIDSQKIHDDIDYVFIATPDRTHREIAEFWEKRLNSDGKIFIEKALDVSISKARQLKDNTKLDKLAFGFDHYLAKVYPFLKKRCLRQITTTPDIKFNIIQKDGISSEKAKTLDKGVIFDLFCHVLAVVSAVIAQDTKPSEVNLKTVKPKKVCKAQYKEKDKTKDKDHQIPRETAAFIKFSIENLNKKEVTVIAKVGKGVGDNDVKNIKINGEKKIIKLDSTTRRNRKLVENYLKAVLRGDNVLSIPGVMSFNAAFTILEKLDEFESASKEMGHYETGTPFDKIFPDCNNGSS